MQGPCQWCGLSCARHLRMSRNRNSGAEPQRGAVESNAAPGGGKTGGGSCRGCMPPPKFLQFQILFTPISMYNPTGVDCGQPPCHTPHIDLDTRPHAEIPDGEGSGGLLAPEAQPWSVTQDGNARLGSQVPGQRGAQGGFSPTNRATPGAVTLASLGGATPASPGVFTADPASNSPPNLRMGQGWRRGPRVDPRQFHNYRLQIWVICSSVNGGRASPAIHSFS